MAATSSTQAVGLGNTPYLDNSCKLICSLQPLGALPVSGNITAKVFIDASLQNNNGAYYVQRHYDVLPATSPNTSTATVTLYALQSEFDSYNALVSSSFALPTSPVDTTGIANLRINQYHGTPTGGYAPSNYPATWGGSGPAQLVITPTSVTWNNIDNRWEITFPVKGFGGFFVSGGNINPLAINMISSSAHQLNVYPSPAKDYFVLETSTTGLSASVIDVQGKVISNFAVADRITTIDIKKWASGIYTLRFSTGEAIRLVKE